MVESRISMRASSWSTPVSLLDFVKKKKSIEKSNFRQKSHLKIVLDSNYYILIVQLNQRDPIILKFRTQSNFQKNLTALLLKFLIRHVCPSKRKLAWTIEDGHISEDRTTFARDVVLDHFWSIESRQLRRKLALSHASFLSLSLYTCNGIPMFRFSPVYHLESHLDLSKSAIVSPAERKMVARTCAGFLLPSIVGKNLSFTDKASSFNGTPLMRDILVDREISGTWSLVSYRREHAVCSIRFFSLLSFSHGFDNWFCLAIIISVYG